DEHIHLSSASVQSLLQLVQILPLPDRMDPVHPSGQLSDLVRLHGADEMPDNLLVRNLLHLFLKFRNPVFSEMELVALPGLEYLLNGPGFADRYQFHALRVSSRTGAGFCNPLPDGLDVAPNGVGIHEYNRFWLKG